MTRDDILHKIRDILADVLDQDDLVISGTTVADEVEDWDSINHVRLIVALETSLGIAFETAEIGEVQNVDQLIDLIQTKI